MNRLNTQTFHIGSDEHDAIKAHRLTDAEDAKVVEDCAACGEFDGSEPDNEKCAAPKRGCGHHCNHTWSHDQCCWCGVNFCEHSCPRSGTVHDCAIECCDGVDYAPPTEDDRSGKPTNMPSDRSR